jgi:PEGA domain
MPNRLVALASVFLLASQALPQNTTAPQQSAPATAQSSDKPDGTQSATPTSVPAMTVFGLEDATPVKLRMARTISSADSKLGDTVDFEVLEEVRVNGVLLVPKGGIAWATVTEAQPKRRMGREGKLNINIDAVRLVDGEKVPLRAVKETHGGGHVGAMTTAIVATSIVFFPAAPLFLFMHGKDITIPKGTEITAYVNGNTPLDVAKFQEKPTSTDAAASSVAPELRNASVEIASTPVGADIEIDGKFMGNTPSMIPLTAGEHTLKISKSGFGPWERTMTLSGGNIKVSADLDAAKPE